MASFFKEDNVEVTQQEKEREMLFNELRRLRKKRDEKFDKKFKTKRKKKNKMAKASRKKNR